MWDKPAETRTKTRQSPEKHTRSNNQYNGCLHQTDLWLFSLWSPPVLRGWPRSGPRGRHLSPSERTPPCCLLSATGQKDTEGWNQNQEQKPEQNQEQKQEQSALTDLDQTQMIFSLRLPRRRWSPPAVIGLWEAGRRRSPLGSTQTQRWAETRRSLRLRRWEKVSPPAAANQ